MKEHLKSMTQAELSQVLKELGQPAFRSKQKIRDIIKCKALIPYVKLFYILKLRGIKI